MQISVFTVLLPDMLLRSVQLLLAWSSGACAFPYSTQRLTISLRVDIPVRLLTMRPYRLRGASDLDAR